MFFVFLLFCLFLLVVFLFGGSSSGSSSFVNVAVSFVTVAAVGAGACQC